MSERDERGNEHAQLSRYATLAIRTGWLIVMVAVFCIVFDALSRL